MKQLTQNQLDEEFNAMTTPPTGEDRWAQFRRITVVEMRPFEYGEDLSGIHMPQHYTPQEGDFIARDPANRQDQWIVSAAGAKQEFRRI